jgi:hypothetical protein
LLGLGDNGAISANLGDFTVADTNVSRKFCCASAINHPATAHN